MLPHVDCAVANVSSINRSTLRWTCWLLTVCSPRVACLFGVRVSVSKLKTSLHPGSWLFALWRISAVLWSHLPSIRSYTNFELISCPSVHILGSASHRLLSHNLGCSCCTSRQLQMCRSLVETFYWYKLHQTSSESSEVLCDARYIRVTTHCTAATAASSCPQ